MWLKWGAGERLGYRVTIYEKSPKSARSKGFSRTVYQPAQG
jgi:hypothetical protein